MNQVELEDTGTDTTEFKIEMQVESRGDKFFLEHYVVDSSEYIHLHVQNL